ncbi:DUF6188 family protein [Streptomyces sp. A1547]|uniref:DUF6188 family protein n=1 Tax=Streptomyces sp. A1547 TaxID=2563105 RepID=UPI00109EA8FD|nr:DUF6188 family protein [Streptomyces sp. A1547]THA30664.1 hypothetical protein E6W17_37270 [Streptomyces sp. A1547]
MRGTEAGPDEHEDRWILNLRGRGVAGIAVDHRLTPALGEEWKVALEVPARLSSGPAHTSPGVLLVPETQDVAPVLPLFGTKVVSAVAFKSGTLRMVFGDGTHLRVRLMRISKRGRSQVPEAGCSCPCREAASRSGAPPQRMRIRKVGPRSIEDLPTGLRRDGPGWTALRSQSHDEVVCTLHRWAP